MNNIEVDAANACLTPGGNSPPRARARASNNDSITEAYLLDDLVEERCRALSFLQVIPRNTRQEKLRNTEIVLPDGYGNCQSFLLYLNRLRNSHYFGRNLASGRNTDEILGELSLLELRSRGPRTATDRPRIAVMLSEPDMLGGYFEKTGFICQHILARGGIPVLIPPCADLVLADTSQTNRQFALMAIISALAGWIGPGGCDIEPQLYGQQNVHSSHTNYYRDRFEWDLVKVALTAELSFLGICRSHQLANLVTHGTMIQSIFHQNLSSGSRVQSEFLDQSKALHGLGERPDGFRNILTMEGEDDTKMAEIVGSRTSVTNTFHNQAIDDRGQMLPAWQWQRFHSTGYVYDQFVVDSNGQRTYINSDQIELLRSAGHHVVATRTVEATALAPAKMTIQSHPEIPDEAGNLRPYAVGLWDTTIYRAHVFHLIAAMRRSHIQPTVNLVLEAMKSSTLAFRSQEISWVSNILMPHLNRGRWSVANHGWYFDHRNQLGD